MRKRISSINIAILAGVKPHGGLIPSPILDDNCISNRYFEPIFNSHLSPFIASRLLGEELEEAQIRAERVTVVLILVFPVLRLDGHLNTVDFPHQVDVVVLLWRQARIYQLRGEDFVLEIFELVDDARGEGGLVSQHSMPLLSVNSRQEGARVALHFLHNGGGGAGAFAGELFRGGLVVE